MPPRSFPNDTEDAPGRKPKQGAAPDRHDDTLPSAAALLEASGSAFWRTKTLDDLTQREWESLCDGCGRCCLVKLEDEDTGKILRTDIRLPPAGRRDLPLPLLRHPTAEGSRLHQIDTCIGPRHSLAALHLRLQADARGQTAACMASACERIARQRARGRYLRARSHRRLRAHRQAARLRRPYRGRRRIGRRGEHSWPVHRVATSIR